MNNNAYPFPLNPIAMKAAEWLNIDARRAEDGETSIEPLLPYRKEQIICNKVRRSLASYIAWHSASLSAFLTGRNPIKFELPESMEEQVRDYYREDKRRTAALIDRDLAGNGYPS